MEIGRVTFWTLYILMYVVQCKPKPDVDILISSYLLMIGLDLDVCLMKYKSKLFDKFKEYQRMVEKQIDKSIKTLRSDRRGEYLSSEFLDYLK